MAWPQNPATVRNVLIVTTFTYGLLLLPAMVAAPMAFMALDPGPGGAPRLVIWMAVIAVFTLPASLALGMVLPWIVRLRRPPLAVLLACLPALNLALFVAAFGLISWTER